MRVFATFLLAVTLMVVPVGHVLAQASRAAPRGVDAIPDYRGLYVADAGRFMAGAFVVIMLTRPRDARAFLAQVKTCAADRNVLVRLRREGLNTAFVAFEEVLGALRAGACDVFVGTNFDFAQLDRRLDDGGRPSDDVRPPPWDDVQPPPRDDVTPGDDVVVDRTPPEIAPLREVFEERGRRVQVRARITDGESGIRLAYVLMPGGQQVQMQAVRGGPEYVATVGLPRNFNDQTAFVVATNTANLSSRAGIALRLLPWCGPRAVVSGTVVRQVQDGLTCVGVSPGASDGALGPNTCRAIAGYLGGRMDGFNAGRLPWTALRDELDRACRAAQPVVLDVPNRIERDSDLFRLPVGLTQAGATEAIRITGPGIRPQQQAWRGQPLVFTLPMPIPGQQSTILVEAIGPRETALDSKRVLLIRPAVEMNVRPAGTITVADPFTEFTVQIPTGASDIDRIEARPTGSDPVVQFLVRGASTLSIPSPAPGTTRTVTFVAIDRRENAVARQTVTMERPAPALPPRLSLHSAAGRVVDAASVRLRIVLENPGNTAELVLRGGPDMAVLEGRPTGNGIWDTTQELPPPGQAIGFLAQAVDRAGRVLAEDAVEVSRPGIGLDVSPTGRFEADTDSMIAQARVTTGADWVTAIVARTVDGAVLTGSALGNGPVRLKIAMPEPGQGHSVEVAAIGRDGNAYAPQRITLVRPAAEVQAPVILRVSSPDGFAVDADITRLTVGVDNPGSTANIVVSELRSGEVLARAAYAGTDWRGQVRMPAPGEDTPLVITAQDADGATLATSQIMLVRPATRGFILPPWVRVGGLLLVGVALGLGLARLRGRHGGAEAAEDRTRLSVRPRLYAEPDHKPSVELAPSAPPTLTIWVDDRAETRIEIDTEQDEEQPS